MTSNTDDLRITQSRPLLPPAILMEEIPLSTRASDTIVSARQAIEKIIDTSDDRLVVVVGPCSIHDTKAALEYADLLLEAAREFADDLLIVMRVYFEKPRTTVGWKGLINDPHLDNSFDVNHGLRVARQLLVDLAEKGLPAGCEFLDTIMPQFIADMVSWGAIGARTTESQVHRELASGLSMPVGFKNGTDGGIQIAIDAIGSSSNPHHFLSVTKQGLSAIITTAGNPYCHVILRGSSQGPNYDAISLAGTVADLEKVGLPPRVMIDCSHGNSRKDHRLQPEVAREIGAQIAAGDNAIFGVMLESFLQEGKQSSPIEYGKSITDACISWDDTLPVLAELAAAVRARRQTGV
ncbi:MAG: 3-deoxy-7-phosphoheptulonate synthase [Halieaceae bacterium]|jgi:3-deoxy-7-phosphoheptulonate synthase